jgi:hypothetical protein
VHHVRYTVYSQWGIIYFYNVGICHIINNFSFHSDIFVDPNSFFSDSDPCTNILTRNFLNCSLSLLSYVFWNQDDRERKIIPTEKRTVRFFLFQVFDLRFFTKNLYFTTVSGSESKSELFFGFGSSRNIRIISDPQHCTLSQVSEHFVPVLVR